ncbi:MAG: ABC transporter permease subunit, partial [Bacilli bacterium]
SSASQYAGISIKKSILKTMALSGALAGLAGVSYYLGYFASIAPRTLSSIGFDGIAIALLGNNDPIGIIFSSFFITIITKGSTYLSSSVGVQAEIASVITAIILIFSSCSAYYKYLINKKRKDVK